VEVKAYNHARPIVNIFTAINDYANKAEAAEAAEITPQLINIGLIIITRSTIFASNIQKWHSKPEVDKTLPNFKHHFKTAQKGIKKSQPTITTDSLGFHKQAYTASIVDQVVNRLTAQRDDKTTITPTAEEVAEQQMQEQLNNMANSTQQTKPCLNKCRHSRPPSLTSNPKSTTKANLEYDGGSGCGSGRDRCGGCGGRGNNRLPPKYCWTHGNCAHNGAECETKSDGPINDATYSNMKTGAQKNVTGCDGTGQ
jgi:hypothetical protein